MTDSVRTPTPRMIQMLVEAGLSQAANPEVFGSYEAAFAAISANLAKRWSIPGTDAQKGAIKALGAKMGWIGREYPGASKMFLSMQIDVLRALDAYDASAGAAREVALQGLLAHIRQHFAKPAPAELDKRERRSAPAKPLEEAPF